MRNQGTPQKSGATRYKCVLHAKPFIRPAHKLGRKFINGDAHNHRVFVFLKGIKRREGCCPKGKRAIALDELAAKASFISPADDYDPVLPKPGKASNLIACGSGMLQRPKIGSISII